MFRIHRLREDRRQQFRGIPHTSGVTTARLKDYEKDLDSVEAVSLYSAWAALRGSSRALQVGDVLEDEQGALAICKYTGFDEARWAVPEPAGLSAAMEAVSSSAAISSC